MKKILSMLLKISITVALFWWLFRQIHIKELLIFYHSIPINILLGVFVLGLLNITGQGLRFFYSVHQLMPKFTLKQAVISHFSGFTLRLVLPGSIGEMGKTFLLPGTTKQRIYTYLIDIFYSTGTHVFFFGISTYLLYPKMWYMLGFCVIYVVLFWIYRLFKKNTNFKNYIPEYVPYLKIGIVNISLSILTTFIFILQYWVMLRSYGISLFDQGKVCFFILGVASIPVSFAGLGLRESAANITLQPFGIPSEVAIGSALFIFFVNVLLPALIGVILLNFFSDIKYHDIRKLVTNNKKKQTASSAK